MSENKKTGFEIIYSEQTILDAVTNELQSTSTIADKVGCSWDTARQKLIKLHEAGKICKLVVPAGTRTKQMSFWHKPVTSSP